MSYNKNSSVVSNALIYNWLTAKDMICVSEGLSADFDRLSVNIGVVARRSHS